MPGDSDVVIATTGLRKEFRSRRGRRIVAVDDLDLAVAGGGVHGFLGPNGSGKTTTIRMLLGLARASGGEMRLFGERVPHRLPQVIGRVGAVVEEPSFLSSYTGRRNLLLLAGTVGLGGREVDAALERVGLQDRGRERYRGYSLGMKQRLAIAATLLKSPDLLILDEPTNGLDPAGIRDIRTMIRNLGEQNVTVLLSSHILAEVQQVCSSVSIIGKGRLLASGTVDDLVDRRRATRAKVAVADPVSARAVLEPAGLTVRSEGDHLVVQPADDGELDPEQISRTLAGADIFVRELTPLRADLESVFLRLTRTEGLPSAGHEDGSDGTGDHKRDGAP
jgi:ABC-2 type transport system ATP-binding protein